MNKIKRVIFSDLDGTIVGHNQIVSKLLKQKVWSWIKHKHRFIIATGRLYSGVKYFIDQLGLDDYTVCCSGAIIYDNNANIIYEKCVDRDVARRVWEASNKLGGSCHIYCSDTIIANNHSEIVEKYNKNISEETKKYKVPIKIIRDFNDIDEKIKIHKVSYIANDDEYKKKFLDMVGEIKGINTFKSYGFLYDIISNEASKGNALNYLRGLEIADKYIAVGDNENDLSMFEASDISAAMGNSKDVIKECADITIGSVDEDGVANFIVSAYKI